MQLMSANLYGGGMEFEVKITGLDTLAAAVSDLARALSAGVKADQLIDGVKASSRKTSKAKAEAQEQEAAAEVTAPAPVTTPAAEPVAEVAPAPAPVLVPAPATPIDLPVTNVDEAKNLVLELTKVKGRPIAADVLTSFGAARLGDVPAEKIPALIEALTRALES
jgi:hypothetical protein